MRAVDVLEALELLGSSQWGLVTALQAQEAGVSKMRLSRLAEGGTLQRVRHGVYALPSAGSHPLQALRAAWLATNTKPAADWPVAVVSGESAAAVHGLGDLLPSKYEFTTAVRRQTSQTDVRYRKRVLPSQDSARVDGLPVTTVARTVADLAAAQTDFDHLAAVVYDALTGSSVTSSQLVEALEPAAGRFGYADGSAALTALLESVGYRPGAVELNLVASALQKSVFRSVTPQLQDLVKKAVVAQLLVLPKLDRAPLLLPKLDRAPLLLPKLDRALLLPKLDLAPWASPSAKASLPQTKEVLTLARAVAQTPRKKETDGSASDTAGGGEAAEVSGSSASQRSDP